MIDTGRLKVVTSSDREIAMIRVFDAPRALVFEAFTRPELVKRWLGVFDGWELAVCEIDLRVGGTCRYVWEREGVRMGMRGVYREIVTNEKIVFVEKFDEPWYEGEAVSTMLFVEHDGKTTHTNTVTYASKAVRDGVLEMPLEQGMEKGYAMLADLLASMPLSEAR